MHQRNTDGLKTHAQCKRDQAFERAEAGVRQLIKEGRPINFETVKEVSGVSRAWLYNQPELRQRIEQLRGQSQPKKSVPSEQRASQASNAAKVKTLLQEVKKLRAENQGLRHHLENAHGRALYADEQTERYKREVEAFKAENAELKKLLNQYCSQNVTAPSSKVISLTEHTAVTIDGKANQIQTEIANLGIKLNSTLNKVIKDVPEDTVLTALKALKEAMTAGAIKNPAGWLKRAIEDGWQPNNIYSQTNEDSNLKMFNKWFPKAQDKRIVIASTRKNGNILVLTPEDEWIPFTEVLSKHPLETL